MMIQSALPRVASQAPARPAAEAPTAAPSGDQVSLSGSAPSSPTPAPVASPAPAEPNPEPSAPPADAPKPGLLNKFAVRVGAAVGAGIGAAVGATIGMAGGPAGAIAGAVSGAALGMGAATAVVGGAFAAIAKSDPLAAGLILLVCVAAAPVAAAVFGTLMWGSIGAGVAAVGVAGAAGGTVGASLVGAGGALIGAAVGAGIGNAVSDKDK